MTFINLLIEFLNSTLITNYKKTHQNPLSNINRIHLLLTLLPLPHFLISLSILLRLHSKNIPITGYYHNESYHHSTHCTFLIRKNLIQLIFPAYY